LGYELPTISNKQLTAQAENTETKGMKPQLQP